MCRSLSKSRRSPGASKDPSRTGRHVEKYASGLRGMLDKTKREILAILKSQLKEREMATYTVDVKTFKQDLAKAIEVNWRKPSSTFGSEVIGAQIARGNMMAEISLANIGAEILIGNLPVDSRVYSNINERNLTELMAIGDEMEKKIVEQLTTGIDAGEGIRDISKRIISVTDFSQNRASMVARTETMSAFNKAAEDKYKKYGIDQVMWKTGGSNICNEVTGFDGTFYAGGCQGLNREVFDIGGHPPCPLHPNCKCILDPVIPEVD